MGKKVLWISIFAPLSVQEERLRNKFGHDIQIVHHNQPIKSAEEVAGLFREKGYDDWVVVGLSMGAIGRVCELAEEQDFKKPLWTNMRQLPRAKSAEADLRHGARFFKFLGFRRVKRLVFEFQEGEDF